MLMHLPALLLICCAAAAQSLADPAAAAPLFDAPASGPALKCTIKSVEPALNFGLRFQAGYAVNFALGQLTGSGHVVRVLLRVTPDHRPPVFLTDFVNLPNVPPTRLIGSISGSILVGEGDYRVEARVDDDQHRVCRTDWRMHARRQKPEQQLTPAMPPGAVATLSSSVARTQPAPPDAPRLTVLLHAAPLRGRGAILQAADIQRLTGALSALLEQVPAASVRLIVFNTDQQKQLLLRDNFTASDVDIVAKALDQTEVATVDYSVLRDPRGGATMLSGMLKTELRQAREGDAVVLLGPEARTRVRLPDAELERPEDSGARLFYLHFLGRAGAPPGGSGFPGGRGTGGRGGGGGRGGPAAAGRGGAGRGGGPGYEVGGPPIQPDTLQRIVKRLKGTVLDVRTPQDFARAVARLNRPQ